MSLYDDFRARLLPENAAAAILASGLALDEAVLSALRGPASRARSSSMSEDFYDGTPCYGQTLDVLRALLRGTGIPVPDANATVEQIDAFLDDASEQLAVSRRLDFLGDRLNAAARKTRSIETSRRMYNRQFRSLRYLDSKLTNGRENALKLSATRTANSRLAHLLPREDFDRDPNTAAFLTYYAARASMRSVFTNQSQARAYDEVCDRIMRALVSRADETAWFAIAFDYPDPSVTGRLAAGEQGELLGLYFDEMRRFAEYMRRVWDRNRFNAETMIVKRGDDSSTWNAAAGAWNKLRQGWLSLLYALEAEDALDAVCPGKAMRLMAADVAAWHRMTGGDVDPQTRVWAMLPRPWNVLLNDEPCGRDDVQRACLVAGVNPEREGWTAAPERTRVARTEPTPELVHGVAVGSPELAAILRRAGVFSGQFAKLDRHVDRSLIDAARREHARKYGGPRAKGATPPSGDDGSRH